MVKQKNTLYEHLRKSKNGTLLLEQIKNRQDIGIGSELLSGDVLGKKGEELIADSDMIRKLREYRSTEVYHILNWKLSQYQWDEWITCLDYKIFLDFTVPMLSKVLEQNPLIAGVFYRGEILYRILKLEDSFWEAHKKWKVYFETMLEQVFTDYSDEEIKMYVGDRIYNELRNCRKAEEQ